MSITEQDGAFFAVDQRSFAKAISLGMNAAIVYLVLACGTGRDNLTTSWSVNAVEKYTGIGRSRVIEALNLLIANDLVRHKSKRKPSYKLVRFYEIGKRGQRGRRRRDAQQWVWLPNTIVTSAANEIPPIERIRQSQNVAALRLFIDLYAEHSTCGQWRH
jgi:hypothetical protein